jgi:hypothetical protein
MSEVAIAPQDAAAARPSLRTHVTGMVVGGARRDVAAMPSTMANPDDVLPAPGRSFNAGTRAKCTAPR